MSFFNKIFLSKIIISIIIYILYVKIREISLEEYNQYLDGVSHINNWINTIDTKLKIKKEYYPDSKYIESMYQKILLSITMFFIENTINDINEYFHDLSKEIFFEYIEEKKTYNICLQWYDKSINPLCIFLFPNILEYLTPIPSLYYYNLTIIKKNCNITLQKKKISRMVIGILSFIKDNLKINDKKIIPGKMNLYGTDENIIINNNDNNNQDSIIMIFYFNRNIESVFDDNFLFSINNRVNDLTSRFKPWALVNKLKI